MLPIGSTISHFEILEKLGEGGMGIVFKARDRLLGRVVAIKVMPSPAGATEEHRHRFVQEARSASALNHPNIITVYEIGTADQVTFIAMEYAAGRTLHEELRRGRLSIRQALDYSIQIADALSAAHTIGVIHRDIKPANILVTEKGLVKVVDFGLAKLTETSYSRGLSGHVCAATATMADPLTEEGTIVGTVSYMSPEQAEGKRVDTRSDIFSFGAVLYEMLTGRRAFSGSTNMSTLAAILTQEPLPILDICEAPASVAKIVSRCLRKDPSRRFQVMPDVTLALEELRDDLETEKLTPSAGPVRNGTRVWLILAFVAAIVVAVCAMAAMFVWGLRPRTSPTPTRFTRLTFDSGLTTDPAISPDGKLIAYASDRSGRGDLDIWVQQTAGGAPVRLTTNEANDRQPAFSPDASKVVFRSERENGGIYVVSALGGDSVRVARDGFDPQFSPDGRRIAFWTGAQVTASTPSKIFVVPAIGGVPEEIRTGLPFARHPIWTPDGKRLLFWGVAEGFQYAEWYTVEVGSEGGATQSPVSCDWFEHAGRPFFLDLYPLGWIGSRAVFRLPSGDAEDLWSIPISYKKGRATGAIQRLTAGVDSAEHPGVSPNGRIVWAKVETGINVWSLPVDANTGRVHGEWQQITTGSRPKLRPNLSRDGTRAVFNDGTAIAVMELGTGRETIIAESGVHASLTADGSKVAYAKIRAAAMDLYIDPLNGDVPEKVCNVCGMPSGGWSTDQQKVLYDAEAPQVVSLFDVKTRHKTELLRQKGRAFTQAGFSPDDRWIVFLAGAGPGRQQVFVIPYRGNMPVPKEKQWIAITDGLALDSQPRWSPDGNLIYFVSNKDGFRCIWARRVDPNTKRPTGEPFAIAHLHSARWSIGNIPSVGQIGLGVSRDRIVVNLGTSTGNIWIADFN